jgi:hypothetical protein
MASTLMVANGLDSDGRTALALARLGDRAGHLERTVVQLQADVRHLPTKTTMTALVMALIAVIGIVTVAYWNGVAGKFEAVNAKIDGTNSRLDGLSRAIDKLLPAPGSPSPVASPHH